MRAKWSAPIRKYWKISEQMMVKYCDLAICDSVNFLNTMRTKQGGNDERILCSCRFVQQKNADKNEFRVAIQNIRKICSRKDVQTLIRNYPKASFNKSQYVYNFAMEHMWIYAVYFLTWLQNKRKRIE